MNILPGRRDRRPPRTASADQRESGPDDPLPFAGYNRLDDRQVITELRKHSQIELEAVEAYERSHENRRPVLNKLHYMRGPEPLPGYDALSVEEVADELTRADLSLIQAIRGYERKFANRPTVLVEVARAHRHRQAIEPAKPTPGYQPMSAGR